MSEIGNQGQDRTTPPPPPGGAPTPPPPPGTPPPGYPPAPPAYPAQPGHGYTTYYPQAPRTDGLAIAGMVCGIAGIPLALFCGIGLIPGVLGIVFGLIAIGRVNRSGGMVGGKGMALAGAICGGVAVVLAVLYWVLIIVSANS